MLTTDPSQREDYIRRITKVLNFIEDNLDAALSLETVAAVAHYSPYHFHRLFKLLTSETLNTYINRKRIEKAASSLMRQKEVNITELSLHYGFNSHSAFTRAFKKFYGMSPTEFRKSSPNKYSKIGQTDSKNGQTIVAFEEYLYNITNHIDWMNTNSTIAIKELPTLELAYLSSIGIANLRSTFEKLMRWAKPKGLMDSPDLKMLTIFHDSFKITAPDKVRMSACIVLNKPVSTDGEVETTRIEKGNFIVGHFELKPDEFEKAWTGMYIWMNENGYKVTEKNSFEIYYNDFTTHPEKKSIVDLCIPID
ncbi:MAG: AraC family transcriptional regulator [Chitinophagaceae bacterium]|nr:AraC family transcriptional regulator [Chitinophagaceae bacterium]